MSDILLRISKYEAIYSCSSFILFYYAVVGEVYYKLTATIDNKTILNGSGTVVMDCIVYLWDLISMHHIFR